MSSTTSAHTIRAKKSALSKSEKNIVFNQYKSELLANPGITIEQIAAFVARKTGVSKRTVFNIIKEYKINQKFSKPKINKNHRKYVLDSYDNFQREAVHKKVHELVSRNEMLTLNTVLQVVNEDNNLPNFKRTTFYKFLKTLNLKWTKQGQDRILLESEEIIAWRKEYLKKIKRYRDKGMKIYYLYKTWINIGSKVYIDNIIQSSGFDQASELNSLPEKRLIIYHIGSNDGFVPDSLWVFESNKLDDYNEEMDGNIFENWLVYILPKLVDNAVIVLDDASYNSKIEKHPTTDSNKTVIKNWLSSKDISFNEEMLKPELLALVKKHKDQYKDHFIDEIAPLQGKTVLRLPPYHCELNPVELIWAQIKCTLDIENTTLKFAEMKRLLHEMIRTISTEKWQKYIQQVLDAEDNMSNLYNIDVNTSPIAVYIKTEIYSDSSD